MVFDNEPLEVGIPRGTASSAHDDVIKWKHFPRYWPFVRGIHRSPVKSPHKGQWRGALMFSLTCVWINGWINNHKAGNLIRYRVHYDVIVMNWVTPAESAHCQIPQHMFSILPGKLNFTVTHICCFNRYVSSFCPVYITQIIIIWWHQQSCILVSLWRHRCSCCSIVMS